MLRDSLGLTDVGAKNFRRGVFFCTLAKIGRASCRERVCLYV